MERQMTIGLVLTVLTAFLVMAFTFTQPQRQVDQQAKQLNLTLKEGAHLFVQNQCYSCHGNQGQGVVGPAVARTQVPTDELVRVIANGRVPEDRTKPAMPAFGIDNGGTMRPHQLEALAVFLQNWDQGRIDRELALKNSSAAK